MIPKIHQRGQSFKGVAAYLSHDKDKAQTTERVAWTHTENMHTDDIEKAAKVMAWTDKHRNEIRAEFGGSAAGRKAENGNVYHRSLSWALGESPSDKHMLETALAYIKNDGLSEHQSFIVAHNDTAFKHLHIGTNLVHPETGLIHDVGLDKRRAQKWAIAYEREHGIYVQTRIDNAEKRAQGAYIKDRDTKQDYSDKITRAYYASDNGKAFIQALKEEGLELGKARRGDRNFVIVDDQGDIQKLSRQLQIEEKGKLKTEAIQALLSDIDRDTIRDADHIAYGIKNRDTEQTKKAPEAEQTPSPSDEKQADTWDRDQANRQWEESIIDAAIQKDQRRQKEDKQRQQKQPEQFARPDPDEERQQWADNLKKQAEQRQQDESYAATLDGLREMEGKHDRRRLRFEETLEATYNRSEEEKLLSDAQDRAEKADNALGRVMGWRKTALEEVEAHQKTRESIQQREDEQREALESKILAERQQAGYDLPAPEMEPKSPELDLQDQYQDAAAEPDPMEPEPELDYGVEEDLSGQYEQAASPAPEIEQPEPEPQIEQPDLSQQYDNAAQTQQEVSTPSQDTTPDQGQSVDQSQSGPSHDVGGMSR